MSYYTMPRVNYMIGPKDLLLKFDTQDPPVFINYSLSEYLSKAKTAINEHFDKWSSIKKYTNPYEFIHTQYDNKLYISKLKPLSRAYYKMIEIIKMFHLFDAYKYKNINTFHLAEGPGGFIEAVANVRNNKNDNYFGMTLIDKTNHHIPGWNKAETFLSTHKNVRIEAGVNSNGDLYNHKNLLECFFKYGNSMNIITGDGGFDFSIDYNKQEQLATRLIFSQIAYAVLMQKHEGTFILKVFNVFLKSTVDMIFLLSCFYTDVHICKPHTSRYANSEKYIVCTGFKHTSSDFISQRFIDILKIIENIDINVHHIISILRIPNSTLYLNGIKNINAIFGQQQIENINTTLLLIENTSSKREKCDKLKKKNLQKSIHWCIQHRVPYNEVKKTNIFKPGTTTLYESQLSHYTDEDYRSVAQ